LIQFGLVLAFRERLVEKPQTIFRELGIVPVDEKALEVPIGVGNFLEKDVPLAEVAVQHAGIGGNLVIWTNGELEWRSNRNDKTYDGQHCEERPQGILWI
jgi:hypothetical protein